MRVSTQKILSSFDLVRSLAILNKASTKKKVRFSLFSVVNLNKLLLNEFFSKFRNYLLNFAKSEQESAFIVETVSNHSKV